METASNLFFLAVFLAAGLALIIAALSWTLGYVLLHPPRVTTGVALARGWHTSPDELGLEFDEWILDPTPRVRLPVWDIPNPDCPNGPVVILSHCWGGSKIDSLQRLALVQTLASRVICWDMRAHGEATGGSCHLGAHEVDDLIALLDVVAPDGQSVILYGYSLGAGVSIAAAARDPKPDRVIGVIADGPYRWTREPVQAILESNDLPVFPILDITHRVISRLIIPSLRDSERAQFAARLRCPLLVLHGSDDPVCPVNSALEVAQAAKDVEFVIIPRGGHLDLHHTDAPRYLQTVASFADRCIKHAAESRIPT